MQGMCHRIRDWMRQPRHDNQMEEAGATPTSTSPTITIPFNPPLSPETTGKEYTGGLSDEEAHSLFTEAGREGLHTPLWGRNADDLYLEDALATWDDVNAGLIADRYRRDLQEIDEEMERLDPVTDRSEQDAYDALEEHGDLELEREVLHLEMARDGLEPPELERDWPLAAKLGGLVIADIGLLSVAYQVLDLSSDEFLGIPYLSETALASSGAIFALVLLAHQAGEHISAGLQHGRLTERDAASTTKE